MPRLSLWRPNHTNDYKFFDKNISEQFTVGATDIHIHKYLGTINQGETITTTSGQGTAGRVLTFANTAGVTPGMFVTGINIPADTTISSKTSTTITLSNSTTAAVGAGAVLSIYSDSTKPSYANQSEKNIQDLLFLENRDRKYDTSIYKLRGYYRINDNDFDLTQFGLFLTSDTIFLTVHLNDMVETLGRKLMVGDVIELPHLKDYFPLDDDLPAALKRYYVVNDATKSAEGFSPTWWPHLWRVKLGPLVDGQEYKDILNNIPASDPNDNGVLDPGETSLGELLSTYNKFIDVNDAIIQQAEADVPASGYDTSSLYVVPVNAAGYPDDPATKPAVKVTGYLTGDGQLPNGGTVAAGISFPISPTTNDFFLRLDYIPNRLFRYDGRRWVKVEDAVRTNLTPGPTNTTQRSSFVNNSGVRYKDGLGWDLIKVASPYTPVANANTQSFTLSSKTILTKIPYVSTHVAKTILNGTTITNTIANVSGNISITVSNVLSTNDLLEYTVYQLGVAERQSLSDALRPQADN